MNNKLKSMVKALSEVFEGEPWYGESVMRKLENVPYVIGYKTCIPESHSVSQIVGHLIAWKNFAAEKLKDNKEYSIKMDTEQDWPEIKIESQEEWEALKRELVAAQSRIYEALNEKKNDTFLSEKVPGKEYDFEYLLRGVLQHDIYHLGQIGLIESQLKNKEVDSGVFKA